jgi:opacity protein-like surface antigen
MKKILMVSTLAMLAAGCAQHAAPPQPDVTGSTPIPTVSDSAAPAAAPMPHDLSGAGITLSANYPTQDQVFTNIVNATVPAHWEPGALHSTTGRLIQVNAVFDVSATQVTETFLTNARLGTGAFNGPVYRFQGAPKIANVTFDQQQSDPGVAPTSISFTDDSISVNDSGVSVTNGAKQVLDVTFAQ